MKYTIEGMLQDGNKNPIAFLYRMKDRDKITDQLREGFKNEAREYLNNFSVRLLAELMGTTGKAAVEAIIKFFKDEKDNQDISPIYDIANLERIENELIDHIKKKVSTSEELSEEMEDKCLELINKRVDDLAYKDPEVGRKINNLAYQIACERYFGEYFKRQEANVEKFEQLKSTGKLYCPSGGRHDWSKNLQWLLESFKKGSEFIIMSDVNEFSKYRSSGDSGSGFSREIATCYKLGYRFEIINNEIMMRHPNVKILQNISLESIKMNKIEMDDNFNRAIQDFAKLKGATSSMSSTQGNTSVECNLYINPPESINISSLGNAIIFRHTDRSSSSTNSPYDIYYISNGEIKTVSERDIPTAFNLNNLIRNSETGLVDKTNNNRELIKRLTVHLSTQYLNLKDRLKSYVECEVTEQQQLPNSLQYLADYASDTEDEESSKLTTSSASLADRLGTLYSQSAQLALGNSTTQNSLTLQFNTTVQSSASSIPSISSPIDPNQPQSSIIQGEKENKRQKLNPKGSSNDIDT